MKFKDKNGNIFIPTSKFTEEQMKNSNRYQEIKESNKNKENKQTTNNEIEDKKEE